MDVDRYLLGVLNFWLLNKSLMYNNFERFKCSNSTLLSGALCPISWFTCCMVVNLSCMEPLQTR